MTYTKAAADAPSLTRSPSTTRVMSLLMPMALGLYANFQAIQSILVPAEVEALDPAHKIVDMAVLTMICAATGVLGLAAVGAASDATRGGWGRRAPWLVGMAVGSSLLALALAFQHSLAGVALFFGALWFTLNGFQAAMLAVIPDRVPDRRRHAASCLFGFAGPLGALLGVNVAALLSSVAGYAALSLMMALMTGAFVFFVREPAFPALLGRPAARFRLGLGALESFGSRDFALAYLFRFLMFTAQFSINNYLLYVLQDHIGAADLPGHDARLATGVLSTLRTLATIASISLGYILANRTTKRRIFTLAYAALMAAAMLAPILWPSWRGMLVFGGLGGVAMGLYSTIDLTFMSRVLPNADSVGRDIALLVMAGATAQFVAPAFGGVLIRAVGYDALFFAAALVTLAAGAVAWSIRSVE